MATAATATKDKGSKPMTGGQKAVLGLTIVAATGALIFYERNAIAAVDRRLTGRPPTPPRPPAPRPPAPGPYAVAPTGPVARPPTSYTPPAAVRQPLTPTGGAYAHAPNTTACRYSVMTAQRQLNDLGHSPGSLDGRMGQHTRDAILAFLRAPGTSQTPDVTAAIAAYTARPRGDVDSGTQCAVFGLIDQYQSQASGSGTAVPPNYVPPVAPPAAPAVTAYPPGYGDVAPTAAPHAGRPTNEAQMHHVSGNWRQPGQLPNPLNGPAYNVMGHQLDELGFDPGQVDNGTALNGRQFALAVSAFRAVANVLSNDQHDFAAAVDAAYARHV